MRRRKLWVFLLIAGLLCAVNTSANAGFCGFELGDRVEAAVDHPAGHPTLWEGMTGTVICFTFTWPLPVLVSWDGWTAGHNNDWFCETAIWPYAFNSCWWVHCNEIRLAGGLPELFDGGEAERYFTPQRVVTGRPWQPFEVGFSVWNGGNSDPEATIYVHVYASRDTSITKSDYYIGSTNCFISAGGSVRLKVKGEFPTHIPAGLYYIGWIIDPDRKIEERDETNNRAWVTSYRLTVAAPPGTPSLELWAAAGGQIVEPGEGVHTNVGSRPVSVEASADPNCSFAGWVGTAVTAGKVADVGAAKTSVTVDGQYTLQAVFDGAHLLIDDFEAYDVDSNPLNQTWIDGLGYVEPAPGHPGTHTGAIVDNPRASPDASYKVHGGSQSMGLIYDNTAEPWHSLVERTWYEFQNWTKTGADTLSVWFRGARDNAPEPLYIVVEDYSGLTAASQHPDPQAAQMEDWNRWDIPLVEFENAGAMVSRVKRMYIRVGDEDDPTYDSTGVLYFDDITLVHSGLSGPRTIGQRPVTR